MPNLVKSKARRFLTKLADSLGSDDQTDHTPSHPTNTTILAPLDPEPSLAQSLNALTLSKPSTSSNANSDFVGGFHPAYQTPFHTNNSPNTTSRPSRPPILPVPVTSPQNMSLTMQMALRPASDQIPAHNYSSPFPISTSTTSFPGRLHKPQKQRPASAPPSPTSPPPPLPLATRPPSKQRKSDVSLDSGSSAKLQATQCAGITKAGKQCTRTVKNSSMLSRMSVGEDDERTLQRFCFQHTKELLGPSGFYARKNGEWVNFDDWIPAYLQSETQVSLRVEMEKSRSQRDVAGYIYTFEIRDPGLTVKLKVGRAVNLVRRIDQWGKQCGSKEQVLRGYYPGNNGPEPDQGNVLKGTVKTGEKAAWCHRLERLIHLELSDLATTCVYLESGWPNITHTGSVTQNGETRPDKGLDACADCGSVHKEIFEFRRWDKGPNKGKEWEAVVKPVIERWGKFVELYV